jgi:hypothetical protein
MWAIGLPKNCVGRIVCELAITEYLDSVHLLGSDRKL